MIVPPLLPALLPAIVASGLLHIYGEYRGPRALVYLCKPLTMLLILAVTSMIPAIPFATLPLRALQAGLLFSLLGDVFLMLPSDRFIAGLASFLCAHLCYIVAFTWDATWHPAKLLILIPFLLYGVCMLSYLWPHLGKYRGPVLAYMLVIVAMAWSAAVRYDLAVGSYLARLCGVCLFLVSDSTLAIDRFVGRFRSARALVMSTYFLAQLLIVLSFTRIFGQHLF